MSILGNYRQFATIRPKNNSEPNSSQVRDAHSQTFWREMIESDEFNQRFQSFRLTRLIENGEHSIAF